MQLNGDIRFYISEIQTLFSVCDNLRDKCILMTLYGAGIRLSEVACLKVSDIDSNKMQLFIRIDKIDALEILVIVK